MAVDDPAFVAPSLVMSNGSTGNRPDLAGPFPQRLARKAWVGKEIGID
jgi:hypothetical protein